MQDLFLTETAQLADIVLPAAAAYEKNGTMTNTAGEVQLVRKGGDVMGTRSDFDILRILSHQLAQHGLGQAIRLRTPEAAFDEIRQSVPGYNLAMATLLLGEAERTSPVSSANGNAKFDVPAGAIFSSADTLFTSGSLSRYCTMVRSLPEAAEEEWKWRRARERFSRAASASRRRAAEGRHPAFRDADGARLSHLV